MDTSIENAINDRSLFSEFLRNCAMAEKVRLNEKVTVWFRPFPSTGRAPQLIIYADAGYATLPDSSSVESFIICYGAPVIRDDIIQLKAHPSAWPARKMKRVARSSLAEEAVALSTSIDFGYRIRAVYIETLFGSFGYSQFNAIRPTPTVIPYDYEQNYMRHLSSALRKIFANSAATCWFD